MHVPEYLEVDYNILNCKDNDKLVKPPPKFRLKDPATEIPSELTTMIYDFNVSPTKGMIPDRVQTLEFDYGFHSPILLGSLPSSLTTLKFASPFRHELPIGVLPASLTKLQLGQSYNHSIPIGLLPSGLRTLIVDYHFNQPIIVGSLPHGLTSLRFGADYNQPIAIGALPPSLTYLKFGCSENRDYDSPGSYNQPFVAGALPPNLRTLRFGRNYNQPFPRGVLPTSLTSMTVWDSYGHPMDNGSIPPSVTRLQIHNDSLRFNIPSSITDLTLVKCFWKPKPLPTSIKHFHLVGGCHPERGKDFYRDFLYSLLSSSRYPIARLATFTISFSEQSSIALRNIQLRALGDGKHFIIITSKLKGGIIPINPSVTFNKLRLFDES
ncbi:hypothetical protein SAMD00019534_113380 [Acytostelium subglobosum LB1]|uniref:hypothetical protein n=1 Tax=Acytostelium subglobosum LB1 TaxID=1410327 RepID=UPI000644CCF8|nr:hypothetical protein SAMD00019534_113380 [Acytostelium subglobosum LB1]GAM28162.1 hypothetical protein SAMD00019534_113380 [Acytostelium subglobosum LB1]|eukprot:XP_012748796.1 hypothetical protein SAMD00019534_113380 [Acytostelium subglobosum LB1]